MAGAQELHVRYAFQGEAYDVTVRDTERLEMPSPEHKVVEGEEEGKEGGEAA